MKHYSEIELEHRIQKGVVGNDEHLDECPMCRERFLFLRRLQGAIAEESAMPRDPRVGRLVAGFSGRQVIALHPTRSHPDLTPYGVGGGVMVLAAQTEHHVDGRLVHAVTFSSEPDHVVVRVVRDDQSKKYHLHLLTPHSEDAYHATLTVRLSDGEQIVATTGSDGVAEIDASHAIAWEDAVIAVEPHAV